MNTRLKSRVSFLTAVTWLSIAAGLVLSVMSELDICTESCAEAHTYRFAGMPFAWVGIPFFAVVFALVAGSKRFPVLGSLASLMLCGAIGAELHFVYIQKVIIGKWCPICLGIAAAVAVCAAAVLPWPWRARNEDGGFNVKKAAIRTVVGFLMLLLGIGVSVGLVTREQDAFAAEVVKNQVMGAANSPVELYVFTDWYCPACRTVEDEMAKGVTAALSRAKVVFVDKPLYPKSNNFIPYNLSLLVNDKEHYLTARKALYALAEKTSSPTPGDVEAALKGTGATLTMLDYAKIMAGVTFNQQVTATLKVDTTPTVVAYHRKEKKMKMLKGVKEITAANIASALDEVSGKAPQK